VLRFRIPLYTITPDRTSATTSPGRDSMARDLGNGWRSLGGSSRRYENLATGQTISREAYDRVYGSLAKRGGLGFKAAAKLTPEPVRQSRPARGRTVKQERVDEATAKLRTLKPLKGKQSRVIQYKLTSDVVYMGDDGDFRDDWEDNRDLFDEAITEISRNKKLIGVSVGVVAQNELDTEYKKRSHDADGNAIWTVTKSYAAKYPMTFEHFLDRLEAQATVGDEFTDMFFTVVFDDDFVPKAAPKKRKRPSKTEHQKDLAKARAKMSRIRSKVK
jgi:hypothetical protein